MNDSLVVLPRSERVWARNAVLRKSARNHYLLIHRTVIDLFLFVHHGRHTDTQGRNMVLARVWKYLRDSDHEDLVDPDQTVEDAQLLFDALLNSYKEHEIPRRFPDITVRQCRYDNNGLFLAYFDYDGYDIPF
jgi:hypothetical protein